MPFSPEEVKNLLNKVLKDQTSIEKSAKATFKQFDADGNGFLTFEETKQLLLRLTRNLQLPPIEDSTIERLLDRYDTEDEEGLTLEDFTRLYRNLLQVIRDKFYPSKTILIRRSFFISKTNLERRKIQDVFTFQKKLGSGSFGEVHLVRDKLSKLIRVCKTINKDKAKVPVEQIEAEISFMKTLDHPNVIKIFETYEDFHNVYIIMEYCEGGELMDRVVEAHKKGLPITERRVAKIMLQLVLAIAYCHELKIAHKDLKPENIMFQDDSFEAPLKVIDFGVAELFDRVGAISQCAAGTALYMAPEVYNMRFGLKCDVWSLGCILYLLLCGKLPFMARSLAEMKYKVQCTEPDFAKDLAKRTPQAVSLVQSMLKKDPKQRPSCKRILQHPWFERVEEEEENEVISESVAANLQVYMKQSGLKNALVNMIVHNVNVKGEQIRQLAKLFKALDKDGNGMLDRKELEEGLTEAGWEPWDINRVVQALDVDGTGTVSYTEFLAACYTWRESEINVVWKAFNKLDIDGDGKVTIEEFIELLSSDDVQICDKDKLEEMVRAIDKSGDGYIEWDEFLKFIRGTDNGGVTAYRPEVE